MLPPDSCPHAPTVATSTLVTAPRGPWRQASDGTFGKIISGSALLSIFGGLIGIYVYYGGDGLLSATQRM